MHESISRSLTAILCCVISHVMYAQSGPGGVGSSLSNVLWLDPTKGITLVGGAVNVWSDQSGNGNHATASSAAARPTYVTNSVNTIPSLDFDGTNDELQVPDAASLDLTQWHIFIVVIVDVQKNYNAWLVKGDDGLENFEMLSYNDGNLHTPIRYTDATRTSPNAAAGQVNTSTFEIIEYSYSAAVGRDAWKNNSAATIITDNENKTPTVNALPLYIGNERSTTGRYVDGDIAEIVIFNAPLNSAQKIIVNNYLAAKYNRTLGANDVYTMDNSGNGNFDFEVAGIGRVDASNIQSDSKGSSFVRMNTASGLGNGEFLIWGHDNGSIQNNNTSDVDGATIQARLGRVWRLNEVGDVGTVTVSFDVSTFTNVIGTNLRLLIDRDGDGFSDNDVAPQTGSLSGGIMTFTLVNFQSGDRFTLGTTNVSQTPLPVELLQFTGDAGQKNNWLFWSTATEINHMRFVIERSINGLNWEDVGEIAGAGNSSSVKHYQWEDLHTSPTACYYRLRQEDWNGNSRMYGPIFLNRTQEQLEVLIYPNPVKNAAYLALNVSTDAKVDVEIFNQHGQIVHRLNGPYTEVAALDLSFLPAGMYYLQCVSGGKVYRTRFIVG